MAGDAKNVIIPLHIAARYGIYDVSPYVRRERSVLASGDEIQCVQRNNNQYSRIRRIDTAEMCCEMPSHSSTHDPDHTGQSVCNCMDITVESAVLKRCEDNEVSIENMMPHEDDTAPFPPMPISG